MPLFDALTMPKDKDGNDKKDELVLDKDDKARSLFAQASAGDNKPPKIEGKSLDEWKVELMGKKIGDEDDVTTFSKSNLPKNSRVYTPDTVGTTEFNPQRLKVLVDERNIVCDLVQG